MSNESPDSALHRDRLARALGSAYELRDPLGSGGFAEVYAAWDDGLKREVAVKVLRPELAPEPTFVARFRREAETVAQLRHPNIIPIYQVGEGEGLVYFIMPLVRGVSLGRWMETTGRPPLDEVRRILIETADALHAAHQVGLIHRDVKPDNIMLEGDERRVLVMDFGIAKAVSDRDISLTATGMIIGTPQYMSPEQGGGDGIVDQRSDLYSLGVVGYQMVSGRLPFESQSVIGLLMQHATDAVVPLADLRADCPSDLASAILRCLEKNPARRWTSAADLRAVLTGAAVTGLSVRPSDAVAQPATPSVARRFRIALATLAVIVVMAFGVDLVTVQGIQFAPYLVVVGLFLAAQEYGRLRTAGMTAGEALRSRGSPATGISSAGTASDEADFGDHAARVRQVRADRAALLGLLARLPNSERRVLEDIIPSADRLLAEVTELGRQLRALEQTMSRELPHEERTAGNARRAELIERFDHAVEAMHQTRLALRRVGTEGLSAVQPALLASLREES